MQSKVQCFKKTQILKPIRPLSNFDLIKYYNNVKQFGGVYSRDSLPKLIKPKFYIVNLDDATGPGSHWVCIYNCNCDICYYFDSFGVDPCDEVLKFIRQSQKKVVMSNTFQIQKLGTIMCGYFCIYVCNELMKNTPFHYILLKFEPIHYQNNDRIIKQLLNLF